MNETRGIGSLNFVNDYIGVPYKVGGRSMFGADCYGLTMLFYAQELQILLPDFLDDDMEYCAWLKSNTYWEGLANNVTYEVVDKPVDFCLVRTVRNDSTADHIGVYLGGMVLSAERPSSQCVPLARYLEHHPNSEFGVIDLPKEGFH